MTLLAEEGWQEDPCSSSPSTQAQSEYHSSPCAIQVLPTKLQQCQSKACLHGIGRRQVLGSKV